MERRRRIFAGIAIVLVAASAACGGEDDNPGTTTMADPLGNVGVSVNGLVTTASTVSTGDGFITDSVAVDIPLGSDPNEALAALASVAGSSLSEAEPDFYALPDTETVACDEAQDRGDIVGFMQASEPTDLVLYAFNCAGGTR